MLPSLFTALLRQCHIDHSARVKSGQIPEAQHLSSYDANESLHPFKPLRPVAAFGQSWGRKMWNTRPSRLTLHSKPTQL